MTYLLLILKILGLILLFIAFLLLLLIFIVLFVPIRYTAEGEKAAEIRGTAKISWLFHLLRVTAAYEQGNVLLTIKILWFKIFDLSETVGSAEGADHEIKEKQKKKGQKQKKQPMVEKEALQKPLQKKDITNKDNESVQEHKEEEEENPKSLLQEPVKAETMPQKAVVRRIKISEIREAEKAEENRKEEAKNGHTKKAKAGQEEDGVREKEGKGNSKRINTDYFIHMPMEEKKELLYILIQFVKSLLKTVLPKNLDVNVEFGTDDPASTGMLLGALAVVTAGYSNAIHLKGNFQEKLLRGKFRIKGHITSGRMGYVVLRTVFKKPVWKIIKLYWKGM